MINLQEKLYTSTEVASILGVSLRSVYRYIEEGKLDAEVKTATGRHRFTKKDILNFLYPDGVKETTGGMEERSSAPVQERTYERYAPARETREPREEARPARRYEEPKAPEVSGVEEEEEPVDWLSKFRAAATKFKEQESEIEQERPMPYEEPVRSREESTRYASDDLKVVDEPAFSPKVENNEYERFARKSEKTMYYYRSTLGGLKDIAQNIDKSSRESNLDYAFTLNAGLSLHAPIKPFSLLHAYVRPADLQYFEKLLALSPSDVEGAQLCLITSDEDSIYGGREELHGLYVVAKNTLDTDIMKYGSEDLKQEVRNIIQ